MPSDEASSLIKYCSTETCLKILNAQSMRWSAPHLFNDPYELSSSSTAGFGAEQLLKGMIKEATNMLFGPTEPTGKQNRLVAAIARWRDEERFGSEAEAEQVLNQLLGQISEQHWQSVESYMNEWRQFASTLRICCFSDKPTNIHAWQRYGDNHAGFALRFSAGEDTTLPEPRSASYSNTPPSVTTLKQQVATVFGKEAAPQADEFIDKILTRPKHNSAEHEWRCFGKDNNPDEDQSLWYSDKKFPAVELKAIYLGIATDGQDRQAVIDIIREKYRHTKAYQIIPLPGRYELDVEQIGIR